LAAGAKLEIDEFEVGEKVYVAGKSLGISQESLAHSGLIHQDKQNK
jgi:hypothetical protein